MEELESLPVEAANQTVQHLACFLTLGLQQAVLFVGQVTEAMGKRQLVLQLTSRTIRYPQKTNILHLGGPSTSFDDIRRNGNRASPDLCGETEPLLLGKRLGCGIDGRRKFVGQTRRAKLGMISHEQLPNPG